MHFPDFMKKDWMKKIEIRLARANEVNAIVKIIHEAYAPIESILGKKPGALLETETSLLKRVEKENLYAVFLEEQLIGTFTLKKHKQKDAMEIERIAIDPKNQNKGIGSYILSSAEHLARLKSKKVVIIETYEKHVQLVNFYFHRGYTIFRKEISKRGNEIIFMQKKLWRED